MNEEISITMRGFSSPSLDVSNAVLGEVDLQGNAGEPYRGRTQTILRKSFIRNSASFDHSVSIEQQIISLISRWGGSDNISMVKDLFRVESIHIEIYVTHEYFSHNSSVFLTEELLRLVGTMGCSLGFAWGA